MIANVFQEGKSFKGQCLCIQNFTYNTQETLCLTHAGILSSISNFFATIAALWYNTWHSLSSVNHSHKPLRKHWLLDLYIGYDWLILTHAVYLYFVSRELWLTTNFLGNYVLLFSCNLIGQLYLQYRWPQL